MTTLLALLLAAPAAASPCASASDLTLDLRELADSGPSPLEILLADDATSAQRELAEALEALMVAAEAGEIDLIDRWIGHALDAMGPGLDGQLQDFVRDILDDLEAATDHEELAAAGAEAQERLDMEPLPEPEPIAPVTFEDPGATVVMTPTEHAGGSWGSLQETQGHWEAGRMGGGEPIQPFSND